jgi:prepilin-type N-terminal cleavage/methylation domain-containing protein
MIVRRFREAAGFTLIEVMIAIFLIGIGLLAVAPLFVYAAKTSATSADLGTVGAQAVGRMENLRSRSFNSLAAGGSLTSNVSSFFDFSDPACLVRWTIADDATPPTRKTIVVRAQATRRTVGLQKEVQLTTVRVR